jgi:hypothetical protein
LAELRWADAGPMSKYASDQRRRPTSGRRTQLRWADVGPMYVCYLGSWQSHDDWTRPLTMLHTDTFLHVILYIVYVCNREIIIHQALPVWHRYIANVIHAILSNLTCAVFHRLWQFCVYSIYTQAGPYCLGTQVAQLYSRLSFDCTGGFVAVTCRR